MIRNYLSGDVQSLLDIWNTAGTRDGFAPLDAEDFDRILLKNPDFSPDCTFALEEKAVTLAITAGAGETRTHTGGTLIW